MVRQTEIWKKYKDIICSKSMETFFDNIEVRMCVMT